MFELPAIFLAGSLAFWGLTVLAVGLALYAIERENGIGLSVVFVGFFATCAIAGDFNILTWTVANPITAAIVFGLYIVCGAGWALFKFSLFATDRKDEFVDETEAWLSNRGVEGSTVPEGLKAEYSEFLLGSHKWSYRVGYKDVKDDEGNSLDRVEIRKIRPHPVWRENKAKATRWAAAWPLSIFLTFFSDFFRVIFRRIMNTMGRLADAISLRRFAGTEDNYLDHDAAVEKQVAKAKKKAEDQAEANRRHQEKMAARNR